MREVPDTLLPQVAHEELQADEGENTETEDSQDHHVCQLLHGLDQCTHNGLQSWRREIRPINETEKKELSTFC